jgi:ketosteroid isomerase-like protein
MPARPAWFAVNLDGQVGGAGRLCDHFDPRRYQVTHPNEDLMREGFAAFGRGDLDALQSQFFAEDIRWHFPGRSPFGGDFEGVAEVIKWLSRSFEASDGTISLELHDVVANDEHAVALFTARAQRAGKHLEDNTVQVAHIRDGKETEVWFYPADLYATDEFWS